MPSEEFGIDLEGEVAVITDDVEMGTSRHQALSGIRLVMLVNDWSLRNLIPNELAKGFGFYQSQPATAFSPVAVTPDELGDAWREATLHLPLQVHINDQPVHDEPQMPFGGVKDSGWGRFGGTFAMDEFTELRWVTVQSGSRPFPF